MLKLKYNVKKFSGNKVKTIEKIGYFTTVSSLMAHVNGWNGDNTNEDYYYYVSQSNRKYNDTVKFDCNTNENIPFHHDERYI